MYQFHKTLEPSLLNRNVRHYTIKCTKISSNKAGLFLRILDFDLFFTK